MLSSHLQSPEVSKTSMTPDLFHPFHVFSHLSVIVVADHLQSSSILEISLSVQEPSRHSIAKRVLNDVLKGLALFL